MTAKTVFCMVAALAAILMAGCSHSNVGSPGGGGGGNSGASGPPSVAVLQSQMAKVQSDSSIPAGQKAMILGQMQRAISMQQRPRPPIPKNPGHAHP